MAEKKSPAVDLEAAIDALPKPPLKKKPWDHPRAIREARDASTSIHRGIISRVTASTSMGYPVTYTTGSSSVTLMPSAKPPLRLKKVIVDATNFNAAMLDITKARNVKTYTDPVKDLIHVEADGLRWEIPWTLIAKDPLKRDFGRGT